MNCALCHQTITAPEHPGLDGAVTEINPLTNRRATMHAWCLSVAIEALTPEQSDTYHQRIQYNHHDTSTRRPTDEERLPPASQTSAR